MDKDGEHHYVVSRDHQGPLYLGCDRGNAKSAGTSNWFITRDKNEAQDVGNRLEAREIADELNGNAIEAVYNLADPEKRRWVLVGRLE